MTIKERQKKLNETVPAAIAALTDVINVYAELATETKEGEARTADRNLEVIEKNALILENVLVLTSAVYGATAAEIGPSVIFIARRALEATLEYQP